MCVQECGPGPDCSSTGGCGVNHMASVCNVFGTLRSLNLFQKMTVRIAWSTLYGLILIELSDLEFEWYMVLCQKNVVGSFLLV